MTVQGWTEKSSQAELASPFWRYISPLFKWVTTAFNNAMSCRIFTKHISLLEWYFKSAKELRSAEECAAFYSRMGYAEPCFPKSLALGTLRGLRHSMLYLHLGQHSLTWQWSAAEAVALRMIQTKFYPTSFALNTTDGDFPAVRKFVDALRVYLIICSRCAPSKGPRITTVRRTGVGVRPAKSSKIDSWPCAELMTRGKPLA